MDELVESVRTHGILSPLLARPKGEGCELVSGHRRRLAAQKLGLPTVPVLVREMTDDEAVILMVDSNLQRENLLPSEKAFAYKMKLEAMKHQGMTCGQVGHKSRDAVSNDDNGRTIQRYIRLTNLVPPLLQMMDDGRIALSPDVELSYPSLLPPEPDTTEDKLLETIIRQMAEAQGVNEELKARDQMAWVGAMNNIKSAALEILRESK